MEENIKIGPVLSVVTPEAMQKAKKVKSEMLAGNARGFRKKV